MDEKTTLAYEALRAKQLAQDNLLWQTPVLGVAAQSFLLTIAFDFAKSLAATITTSTLAIVLGFASFQLLLKHRYLERISTDRLKTLELDNDLINVHARPPKADKCHKFSWLINFSSFEVWAIALGLTTLGGIVALAANLWLAFDC